MRKLEFLATIDPDGKVRADDPGSVKARLSKLSGKRVHVTVERESEDKTLRQLGYLFTAVLPAWAEQVGYDDEREFRTVLYLAYMPPREVLNRLTGEVQSYVPRLSEATKDETSRFLDRLIREAALAGFEVPEPSYRS